MHAPITEESFAPTLSAPEVDVGFELAVDDLEERFAALQDSPRSLAAYRHFCCGLRDTKLELQNVRRWYGGSYVRGVGKLKRMAKEALELAAKNKRHFAKDEDFESVCTSMARHLREIV